ncbi:bifunctional 5,10-methylenetetrahydrofolate dehydrogenase/5,10-methenyltetrahydrofolate cyclohydrolase [Thermoanaerobacterium sp. DL9XJH110]|uniref:bifunctional 5,10-methylenetetrahydrofolate dehydrogenase/5,10-methenyltetrahydrofolate cyclohydrolase n=1 Tax=Thermoanaerobacterium sp. DL9XJH110 TaxID=3386643 RepID=UPI003BB49D67
MGVLIKGKPVADALKERLKAEVEDLKDKGIYPKLAIIRAGQRPDDLAYERGALKTMENVGIQTQVVALPEDISRESFVRVLQDANYDGATHGILVLRPLPPQLDPDALKYVIAPEKDVDCFSPANVAKVMEGDETGFAPCTPCAVMEMLKYYNVELKGKNVVVIGRSMVVGKPVAMLLLKEHATVTICHSRTRDLPGVSSKADVLVVCVGRAKMITSEYVKDGAVVIDVGINVDQQGQLCGDVDTEDCMDKASMITPVPGGVGSVTTSILAEHVVKACKMQNSL